MGGFPGSGLALEKPGVPGVLTRSGSEAGRCLARAAVDGIGGGAVGAAHRHASRHQVARPRAARRLLRGEAQAEGVGGGAGPRRVVQDVACGASCHHLGAGRSRPGHNPAAPPEQACSPPRRAAPRSQHRPPHPHPHRPARAASTGVGGQLVFGARASVERRDRAAGPVRPPRADPDVQAHSAVGALRSAAPADRRWRPRPLHPGLAGDTHPGPFQLSQSLGRGPAGIPGARATNGSTFRSVRGLGQGPSTQLGGQLPFPVPPPPK